MLTDTKIYATTRTYRTTNPATGETLKTYDVETSGGAEDKLAKAHAAHKDWERTPVEERVRLFRVFADLFESKAEDFARQVTLEMGKPIGASRSETTMVPAMFRYYADNGPTMLAETHGMIQGPAGPKATITRKEALGVVLGIEPWNAPLYQAMRAAAPNLFLGNTVLLKPAEICAGSTLMFDEVFAQAGFPYGAYQTVLASIDQISTYIADPRIRAVTLTGSDRAGAAVGAQAGKHIKPAVLELGGSDAFIVLPTADVTTAARYAAQCRLVLGGQVCMSPKRVILVGHDVAEKFIPIYNEVFESTEVGDGFDTKVTVGPLSSQEAVDQLQAQYEDAVTKGATVLVPGGKQDGPGAFFRPAVIADIPADARLSTEEAFGPLGLIHVVDTVEEAIEFANSSVYGLGGTVFGESEEAFEVASRLDTGVTGINTFAGAPIEIGFGGTKRSGLGRELGPHGMDPFSNVRSYVIG
ncbi:succinate-semialdehyde dehydrogenase [NADP(+)] [Microlunatus endophyticus]|uniref:Succinate-semialdehyde dehydrogenase [NADP(+)] n=1 Tax=Microlunatus endophyticus TaxID=1716077 RepID=A0A917SKS4_9ACTN|nr:aldehyde dehydrogenase family protein [Microlunatus endophyticus]GGL83656.1 succinate-semialdehyde dehydrogenase [NADP(+)] [Microlunatus endophyticus]